MQTKPLKPKPCCACGTMFQPHDATEKWCERCQQQKKTDDGTLANSVMQDLFDAACHGEVKLTLESSVDDDNMPLFTAEFEWVLSLKGFQQSVVSESYDNAADAIADTMGQYRDTEASFSSPD